MISTNHRQHLSSLSSDLPHPSRIAWAGGRISSNADEAIMKFLKRQQAKGVPLTAEQKALLERCFKEEKTGAHRAVVQTGDGGEKQE